MKLHSRLFFLLTITSAATLTSCGGGSKYSYQNITISVSPHLTSIPVNTTMTFTATVETLQPPPSNGASLAVLMRTWVAQRARQARPSCTPLHRHLPSTP
jgi:hypothetical protein